MKIRLMKSIWLPVAAAALLSVGACQQKASTSAKADVEEHDGGDSIRIEKKHFNNNPKQPVEWEVARKKAPDGSYYRHGESKRFTASGKLAEKINYFNNKKEGARIYYYTEGKVWKEQNYKNNELDGECKRYFRSGKVEAEYSYVAGNPCIGLKEFSNTGKQRPDPKLVVAQTDEIKSTGYHRLTASLVGEGLDRVKSVEFYEGTLVNGKIADKAKLTAFLPAGTNKGELKLSVPKGTFIDKTLGVVAIVTTKSGLKLILTTSTHVAVRGA
jgi:antitoxin component YwqK of YwqJK toxin-antitoxin module